MDVPWKVILAFLGVFVAGAIFGGVFTIGVSARRLGGNGANRPAFAAERPLQALPPATQAPKVQTAGPPAPGALLRGNPITFQLLNQFTRKLSPTPEQKDEFRKILGRAGEDLHRLRVQNYDEVVRVTERMYADISAVLTLEQRAELEKMRNQQEEKLRKDKLRREEAAAAAAAEKAGGKAGNPPAKQAPLPTRTP